MNDRSISLLENYDIEVLRTWRGRGAILCETKQGTLIWKEYTGHKEKAAFQDALLTTIRERGFENVESILKNKEKELLTQDQDGTFYILKTYHEGRECNVKDMDECARAAQMLARFHKVSCMENSFPGGSMSHPAHVEFEKHNKELRRVRKYLKERSQKTDFEICLLKNYDYFFNLALQITEELRFYQSKGENRFVCHGDYQHHNIIICGNEMYLINFEKCVYDSPVKDLYLFMRKLLEKSGWVQSVGFDLVNAYEKVRHIEKEEYLQLYYRLAYPEKFWKIVNFYYNSGKAWIPGKNLEKLCKVTEQEKNKREFLDKFKLQYGLCPAEI
ncbi:MAG: CotS family spore coat protein [Lachnospiraceae bacterium]|nr:CotS family spore coat protein [Lachnospiraceae bacterium]